MTKIEAYTSEQFNKYANVGQIQKVSVRRFYRGPELIRAIQIRYPRAIAAPAVPDTLLLEGGGEVVTRDELRLELWAESTFVDFDAGLNAAVRRLRDSLNDSAEEPRYIETLALRVERPETLIPLPVPNVEPPREYHVFITLVSPDPE
jgi:hypothetical protein